MVGIRYILYLYVCGGNQFPVVVGTVQDGKNTHVQTSGAGASPRPRYDGLRHAFTTIWRTEGPAALYKGVTVRWGPLHMREAMPGWGPPYMREAMPCRHPPCEALWG